VKNADVYVEIAASQIYFEVVSLPKIYKSRVNGHFEMSNAMEIYKF
jgi:hypothetical protein